MLTELDRTFHMILSKPQPYQKNLDSVLWTTLPQIVNRAVDVFLLHSRGTSSTPLGLDPCLLFFNHHDSSQASREHPYLRNIFPMFFVACFKSHDNLLYSLPCSHAISNLQAYISSYSSYFMWIYGKNKKNVKKTSSYFLPWDANKIWTRNNNGIQRILWTCVYFYMLTFNMSQNVFRSIFKFWTSPIFAFYGVLWMSLMQMSFNEWIKAVLLLFL